MGATIFRPAAAAAELPQMYFPGQSTETEGRDCLEQALGLMHVLPLDHRLMLGCVLLNAHDDLNGGELSWQRPWLHHAWVKAPDGTIIDPALLANLDYWCEQTQNRLIRPIDQIEAIEVDGDGVKAAIKDHILDNAPHPDGVDLIYLPGTVFRTGMDAIPMSETAFKFWGQMAAANRRVGGWGFDDGIQFHARREHLMAMAMGATKPKRAKGKGFGKGVVA